MLLYILLLLLILSFAIHIVIIISYIQTRSAKRFRWFLITAGINAMLCVVLSLLAFMKPELVRAMKIDIFFWLASGFIMVILLKIKIYFFVKIYRRTKDPKNYHINYFGKKVYESTIIKQYEFAALLLSIPFFLLLGAYFVARLINLILYGHLWYYLRHEYV